MKKFLLPIIPVFISLALFSGSLNGEEFCVSNATELQNALNTARLNGEHDTIKLVQGIYHGAFSYNSSQGYNITLLGGYTPGCHGRKVDPTNTILDGINDVGSTLYLYHSNGGDIVIEGLTVRNGAVKGRGGGIYANSSKTTGTAGGIYLLKNIIIGNKAATDFGGGVFACSYSSQGNSNTVRLIDNIITGNSSDSNGGGVYAYSYSPQIDSDNVLFVNNIIASNTSDGYGGGVYAHAFSQTGTMGDVLFINNTLSGNHALADGGGVFIDLTDVDALYVYNNIIWGNTSSLLGGDIFLLGTGESEGYHNVYSDMHGTWTDSSQNMNVNPLFLGIGDYHLQSNSPCIDKGIPSKYYQTQTDFEGDYRKIYGYYDGTQAIDIGADEFLRLPVFGGNDFDGNGTSDISVWRSTDGRWYIKSQSSQTWGQEGDVPINGDYDGDGTTDLAVWRPSNGRWYINGMESYAWGTASDIPVPGDYNGDGTTEAAVWRPSNGRWYIRGIGGSQWGTAGDIPVPGDYNGDNTTDMAVWRPSNGRWYILGVTGSLWGTAGDIPVPGDYNGDGITDLAVWRFSNSRWYIKDQDVYIWGITGDIPLVR